MVMAEQDSLYHKVIDDLYEQVVDHDRPRGSQFDYCEDTTETVHRQDVRHRTAILVRYIHTSLTTYQPCGISNRLFSYH